jgi:protein-tyrosine phosphatase
MQATSREADVRQITPFPVWVGHAGDGRAFRKLFDLGIRAVVQLAAEEPAIQTPRELVYFRFPLMDGTGNDLELLDLAIRSVASLIRKGILTLVCCGAGMSRSPAIVAAALTVHQATALMTV